jgi:hypothetical protein
LAVERGRCDRDQSEIKLLVVEEELVRPELEQVARRRIPYAAGVVVLLVLAGGGWWIYELWKTHRLNDKLLAAVQDIKDTSEATGSQLWNQAREHFVYRLGDKDGYWGQVIQKKLIQQGLIAAPASAPIVAPSTATPAKQS